MCVSLYQPYRIIIEMRIEAIPLISPVSDGRYLCEVAIFSRLAL